jgi:hypothetical protein
VVQAFEGGVITTQIELPRKCAAGGAEIREWAPCVFKLGGEEVRRQSLI